ncbi:DUF3108 domain-containing protein [Chitinimonas sp. BJYL2]|uniref:DUF3108 domain-containing protein n=1 Tax=Chitinimonas sp. BJYL2 TaxID=2976696 RepID=UPI0022B43805|nr:DUF3108 domain-containing protein [Chitinimonas sp. BJYL2]
MRAWLAPRCLIALLVSLLVHLIGMFGETAWHYLMHAADSSEPIVRKTGRTLQRQQLANERSALPSHPVDEFIVQLGRADLIPAAPPAAMPPPAVPAAPPPRDQPAPSPKPTAQARTEPAPALPAVPVALATPELPALPTSVVADTQAPPPTGSARAVPPPPAPPAPVIGPFPRKIEIAYMVKGLVVAEHRWQAEQGRYQIDTRGSLLGNSFAMHSEGEIGAAGLKPLRFVGYRDDKPEPRYAVEFDWAAGLVTVGEPAKRKTLPLLAGAQDVFSAAYQFALLGEQQPRLDLQVITGRNAYQVTFSLRGEAELVLSGRKITTLVMAGAYEQRQFAFFLAPEWHNLPVRIRYQDGETVHELMAVDIRIDGKTVLERSKPAKRER